MPKVSVIVPIYKVEGYMDKCIDSIINQTLKDLEIILVDDGSPDGCGQRCDEYKKIDSRIKVIHKANGGLSDARNAGLEIASGEYIGFVDSDDYIRQNMFELLVNLCEQHHTLISGCDLAYVYDGVDKQISGSNGAVTVMSAHDFFRKILDVQSFLTICVWNKLYKAELFKDVRFPVGKLYEDLGTMHKLIFQTDRIAYASIPCYYYLQQRAGAITNGKYSNKEYDRLEMNENMFKYIRENQPELITTAIGYRAVNCHLSIINTMIKAGVKDGDMIKLLQKDTRVNLSLIMKSDQSGFKKFQVFLFSISFNLYRIVYHVLKGK